MPDLFPITRASRPSGSFVSAGRAAEIEIRTRTFAAIRFTYTTAENVRCGDLPGPQHPAGLQVERGN